MRVNQVNSIFPFAIMLQRMASPQYPLGKTVGIKVFACIMGIEDPPNWWKASQTLVRSPLSEGLPYSRNPMVLFPVMDFAGEE